MKHRWYKRNPSEFLNGIFGLTAHQIAAYAVLLDLMYDEGGPIRLNERRLAQRCGMRPYQFKKALAELVEEGKLTIVDEHIRNARVDAETFDQDAPERDENATDSQPTRNEVATISQTTRKQRSEKPNEINGPLFKNQNQNQNQNQREGPQARPARPGLADLTPEMFRDYVDKHRLTVDVGRELEKFRNYQRSKGRRLKDCAAGFRNWLLKAQEYAGPAASPDLSADELDARRRQLANAKRRFEREAEIPGLTVGPEAASA